MLPHLKQSDKGSREGPDKNRYCYRGDAHTYCWNTIVSMANKCCFQESLWRKKKHFRKPSGKLSDVSKTHTTHISSNAIEILSSTNFTTPHCIRITHIQTRQSLCLQNLMQRIKQNQKWYSKQFLHRPTAWPLYRELSSNWTCQQHQQKIAYHW